MVAVPIFLQRPHFSPNLKKGLYSKYKDDYASYRKYKDEYMDGLKKRVLEQKETATS